MILHFHGRPVSLLASRLCVFYASMAVGLFSGCRKEGKSVAGSKRTDREYPTGALLQNDPDLTKIGSEFTTDQVIAFLLRKSGGNQLRELREFYESKPADYLKVFEAAMKSTNPAVRHLKYGLIMGTSGDPGTTVDLIETHTDGDERYEFYENLTSHLGSKESYEKIWGIRERFNAGRIYNNAMISYFRNLAIYNSLENVRTHATQIDYPEAAYHALWGVIDGLRSCNRNVTSAEWAALEEEFRKAGADERGLRSLREAATSQNVVK